jgi:hypothetical protein
LKRNITVIPVRVNGADLPPREKIPEDIRGLLDYQALSVSVSGFRYEMAGLVHDIRAIPSSTKLWPFFAGIAAIVLLLAIGALNGPYIISALPHLGSGSGRSSNWIVPGHWVLYAFDKQSRPYYYEIASVQRSGTQVSYTARFPIEANSSNRMDDPSTGVYKDQTTVIDCAEARSVLSDWKVYDGSLKEISHVNWGGLGSVDFSRGEALEAGSIVEQAAHLMCNDALRAPLIPKTGLSSLKLSYLSSTPNIEGDIWYGAPKATSDVKFNLELLIVVKNRFDKPLASLIPQGRATDIPGQFSSFANIALLDCANMMARLPVEQHFDSRDNLVAISAPTSVSAIEIGGNSPYAAIRNLVCK